MDRSVFERDIIEHRDRVHDEYVRRQYRDRKSVHDQREDREVLHHNVIH